MNQIIFRIGNENKIREFLRLCLNQYPILGIDLGSQKTGIAIKFDDKSPTLPIAVLTNKLTSKSNLLDLVRVMKFPVAVVGQYPKGNPKCTMSLLKKFLSKYPTNIDNVIYFNEDYTTRSAALDSSILIGSEDSRAASLLIEMLLPLLKLSRESGVQ